MDNNIAILFTFSLVETYTNKCPNFSYTSLNHLIYKIYNNIYNNFGKLQLKKDTRRNFVPIINFISLYPSRTKKISA